MKQRPGTLQGKNAAQGFGIAVRAEHRIRGAEHRTGLPIVCATIWYSPKLFATLADGNP
jgi:hypothetical protein